MPPNCGRAVCWRKHVRREAMQAGHPSLSRAAKATVQRILAEQPLHPERIRYYLEKRDPAFEVRMRDVLLVYQEVALQNEAQRAGDQRPAIVTVSVDEKPGLQAIANTAPDLSPVPGKHPGLARDHEYRRLGTCSILAALDLHEDHVTARVERRHRSREFIALLQDLDQYYPADCTIRIILDNHSAHIFQRDPNFSRFSPQPFPVRADTETRIVAQYRGDALWQDGSHLSAAYSGALLGGTPPAHPARNRGNQRRAGSPSLEEIRRTDPGQSE
jgi:hypothetical protein